MRFIDKMLNSARRYLTPRLLKSGALYRIGKAMADLKESRYPFKASWMLTQFGLEQARAAFEEPERAAWTTAFAPTEILYAMGLLPFCTEIVSAAAASLGMNAQLLEEAEGRWYPTDSCSFHRCALGAALLEYLPAPKALVSASHLCDGGPRIIAHAARAMDMREFAIDTPFPTNGEPPAEAVKYVKAQLMELVQYLERATGATFSQRALAEAVERSNEARRWMLRVQELRRAKPCPIGGRHALGFIYLMFSGLGSREAPEIFRTLAGELQQRVEKGEGASRTERHRVLWLHLRPYYPNSVFDYLEEELGAVIVWEELNSVYWPEMDPERPYDGLAARMLGHFAHGPAQRRARTVVRAARDHAVDGAIHFSHWGCRQSCGGVQVVRDHLRRAGVPLLSLDGDCIDDRNYGEGQTTTRLAGFVEMLDDGAVAGE